MNNYLLKGTMRINGRTRDELVVLGNTEEEILEKMKREISVALVRIRKNKEARAHKEGSGINLGEALMKVGETA